LFWLDVAQTYGDPILELACGTGRITTFLAEQGLQLIGIDQSEAMLDAASKKTAAVEWIKADIRNFALGRKFPLILIPYFSLQHLLEPEEVESCFQCVKQHLQPNGRFVIEMMHPSPNYLSQLSHASQLRLVDCIFEDPVGRGNVVVTATRHYETTCQIVHEQLFYHIPGETKDRVEQLQFRLYFPQEFEMLLRYNGFEVERKLGDYDNTPFTSDAAQMIVICKAI
jgi:ubiquinone/menaquinone biosynthesis C-methylase UbiE